MQQMLRCSEDRSLGSERLNMVMASFFIDLQGCHSYQNSNSVSSLRRHLTMCMALCWVLGDAKMKLGGFLF